MKLEHDLINELKSLNSFFSKSGYEFYLNDKFWILDQNATIN